MDTTAFLEKINSIDVKLFARQKQTVINLLAVGELHPIADENLAGLLNLLDCITDYIDPIKSLSHVNYSER